MDASLFWNLITAYVAAGAFFAFWYRKQIKMHLSLIFTVAAYDAPDWLTDKQVLAVLTTMYMIVMVAIWPVMITRLEMLK